MGNQLEKQSSVIESVVSIAKKYKSVLGIALLGSHVDASNTPFSDIDLLLVFSDGGTEDIQVIFEEITSIEPTLSTLYQLYDQDSLILYESGIRLDLTMISKSTLDTWDLFEKIKILHESGGVFKSVFDSSSKKSRGSEHPKWNYGEGEFVDWFFWMFRQAYCYLLQSEIVLSKQFEKRDLAIKSVNSIRDKFLDIAYYLNGKRDYLVNINNDLKNDLSQTYTLNSFESIKFAILKEFDIYMYLIQQYCEKEGKVYPSDKILKMQSMFIEFDKEIESV